MAKKLYLAGGLFNAGERLHLLYLEKHLVLLGYEVILPQREALKAWNGISFNIQAIVDDCQKSASSPENIFIGCADGADTDSGTAVEYGMALTAKGEAVLYRTDFRTALEHELGVNAMLRAQGTRFIYEPCYFTELSQVDEYYHRLAINLHEVIKWSLNT